MNPPYPWHRFLALLFALLIVGVLVSTRLRSEEPSAPDTPIITRIAAPPEISHLGQIYVLAQHRDDPSVETDEYVPKGETRGDWSQLVTIQRLRLPGAASPDDMITYLSKRVAGLPGARFVVVQQGRKAIVFSASLPKSGMATDQRFVGIVLSDTEGAAFMDVLQFALASTRVEAGVADMLLDSWRQKFVRQADSRNGTVRVGE